MVEKESTVRMRELGLVLQKALRAAGLENKELARRLGWSPTKVSNLLWARRGASEADVASILVFCDIGGEERERLLRLAREAHQSGWWQEYGDQVPGNLRTLLDHETAAVAISQYQSTLVPGLLQVRDYIRAWMRASVRTPDDKIEELADARIKRQELFNRSHPPQFTFFMNEYVLWRERAGREVMSEQVHHMLRMSVRPYVTIRVIPESVGIHAGYGGPFMLMEFAEINPVLHFGHETSSAYVEEPGAIRIYRRVLAALDEVALDEEQSREWISRVAIELGGPREEHHDPGMEEEQLQ